MILHPAILALLTGSGLVSCVLLYSCGHAFQVVRRWDLASGSESQLQLERKTYLITTMAAWAFLFQLVGIFLFLFAADDLSGLFVGAMCAVGTLALNPYGYPALVLKILGFLLAGVWLIMNHIDNRAPDYPILRAKYRLLLAVAPVAVAEAVVQGLFFLSLEPNVITSCCGRLFSEGAGTLTTTLFLLPRGPVALSLAGALAATALLGIWFFRKARATAGYLFSASGGVTLAVAVAAFTSFLCLYFYELPTHHCPFCVLQAGYGYVGYPLYASLFGGAVLALAVGAVMPFRRVPTLRESLPAVQRRLTVVSLALYGTFAAIVCYRVAASRLVL